jgi:hypothetical protein
MRGGSFGLNPNPPTGRYSQQCVLSGRSPVELYWPRLVGLHQLLLEQPGCVPFDAELAGKLERSDVVLGARAFPIQVEAYPAFRK